MDALKILVVDDEARMRKLVKDFLTNKGFSVIEAGDGEEAVDIFFAQKDISLVLLDVMMPKMDGWEVLKTIRKYSQVPVIMLTARSEERDELQGFSLGVDEYISKPFSPKILVARVDAILRRSNVVSTDSSPSPASITLVVDDEARMRKLVKDFLTNKGFSVIEAGDGEEAVDIFFAQKDISLVLLDVMMPKMDGWEVLKTIRKYSQVPVIMLTARSEERDELQGFSLGVDEYISKPFSPKILVARVDAILRRSNVVSTENMSVGGICIDKAAHQVTIDGREIELSYKEFELLSYFIENQGIALSREKILNNVWNYDYFGDARTIDTHVKKLRSKMGDKGDYIKTIWGMGYKFEVNEG